MIKKHLFDAKKIKIDKNLPILKELPYLKKKLKLSINIWKRW
jgi:hypothetical protein